MAMYYYASKISAVACGYRCKHNVTQRIDKQKEYNRKNNNKLQQLQTQQQYVEEENSEKKNVSTYAFIIVYRKQKDFAYEHFNHQNLINMGESDD